VESGAERWRGLEQLATARVGGVHGSATLSRPRRLHRATGRGALHPVRRLPSDQRDDEPDPAAHEVRPRHALGVAGERAGAGQGVGSEALRAGPALSPTTSATSTSSPT
jgi:hypothetical protein